MVISSAANEPTPRAPLRSVVRSTGELVEGFARVLPFPGEGVDVLASLQNFELSKRIRDLVEPPLVTIGYVLNREEVRFQYGGPFPPRPVTVARRGGERLFLVRLVSDVLDKPEHAPMVLSLPYWFPNGTRVFLFAEELAEPNGVVARFLADQWPLATFISWRRLTELRDELDPARALAGTPWSIGITSVGGATSTGGDGRGGGPTPAELEFVAGALAKLAEPYADQTKFFNDFVTKLHLPERAADEARAPLASFSGSLSYANTLVKLLASRGLLPGAPPGRTGLGVLVQTLLTERNIPGEAPTLVEIIERHRLLPSDEVTAMRQRLVELGTG